MNGRAARRIRRAVWSVIRSTGTTDSFNAVHARLKREYRANPYHKRKGIGYVVLPHKVQELRYRHAMNFEKAVPPPKRKMIEPPLDDDDFYDDHSRFKSLR